MDSSGDQPASASDERNGLADERERAQRDRDHQFRALVDAVEEYAIFRLDPEGTVVSWNPGAERIKGYDEAEIIGTHFSTFYTEADRTAGVPADNLAAAADQGSVEDEGWRVRADGSRFWANVTITAIRNDEGELEGFAKVTRDMTERREYERQLEAQAARLERQRDELKQELDDMFERVDDAFYALDDEFRFTYVNDTAEMYLGRSAGELLGRNVWDAFDVDAADPIIEKFETAMATQDPMGFERYSDPLGIWALVRLYPSETGLSVYFQDITERKEYEQALKRYETLIEESTDVNAILDPEGTFQYLTPSVEHVLGYTPDELVGENGFEYIHPDDREAAVEEYAKMVEDPDYRASAVYRFERTDGSWAWLEARGRNLLEDPDINGIVAYTREITERKEREQELEQYETIIESLNEGVYVVDADRNFQWVNETYAEMLGYSRQELIGENATMVVDDEVIRKAEVVEEEQGHENLPRLDVELQTANGDRVPVHAASTVLPGGEEDGWFRAGVVRDITERKEHERRLAESRQRYRTLAENFPNGSVGLFNEDLEYTAVGGQLLDTLDVEPDDRVGHSIHEIHPDSFLEQIEPHFQAAFDGEANSFEVEFRGRHLSAHVFPVRNDDNEVDTGMVVVREVTEQIERERELERALDLLNKTERIADVAGWEVDPETEEPYWSNHLFDLLDVDYDTQPSLEEALDVYHTEQDRAIVEDAVEEALETGDPFDVEARFPRPDGDVGWLRVQGDPEVENGEVVSLRGAVQDVTERKRREQRLEELVERLEESNERLEQFAYVASHDLREPLRMVSTYLQLIQDRYGEVLDDDGEEFLEIAVNGANRMREMVDDLLAYSRVDTQGEPLEPTDSEAVVERARRNLEVRIEETAAQFDVEPLPTVTADGNQLEQVFQNLFSNAIKYRGDEPPHIEIGAERGSDEWVFRVADNGIGMDPDQTDWIFDVFQRLHTDEEYPGTGIGLALCKKIVDRHGGDIWVESEPGAGSTFYFTIPSTEA